MWLSPKIFEWDRRVGVTGSEDESWRRAHTIWSHAEHLLEQSNTELFRVDAITTLKRSIDHRLRMLDKIYYFRQIPIRSKPSDMLELLDYLGIIRSKMLQKLTEIRNAVEHEDANPPSDEACFGFLEFTWYFLRSTDLLVRQPTQSVVLFPSEDELYYDATIELDPKEGWIPKLTAWVVSSMVSDSPIVKTLSVLF